LKLNEIFWQLANWIFIENNTKVFSNTHSDCSNDLISVINGMLSVRNIIVRNNTNYNTIFRLRFSFLLLNYYIEVSSNNARLVLIT